MRQACRGHVQRRLGFAIGSGAAALALLVHQPLAHAYCRTRVCDAVQPETCRRDADGCALETPALYWPSSCVSYAVSEQGCPSQALDFEALASSIERAFLAYTQVDCAEGAPSLTGVNYGPSACATHQYNPTAPNANTFGCRDDGWPYSATDDVLALTTLTFEVDSGAILDADTELNTSYASFSQGATRPASFDIDAVITHEVGHFLGFGHTRDSESVMFPGHDPEQPGRARLSHDDALGVCAAFAPDRPVSSDSCEPPNGFSPECQGSEAGSQGSAQDEWTEPKQAESPHGRTPEGCAIARPLRASGLAGGATLLLPLLLALAIVRRLGT